MTDDCWLFLQAADDPFEVIGHLTNSFVREDFRIGIGFADGLGIVRPTRCDRSIAGFLEHCRPTVPAAWQQPEPMNKHDWLEPCRVRALNLLLLVVSDRRRRCGFGCCGCPEFRCTSDACSCRFRVHRYVFHDLCSSL